MVVGDPALLLSPPTAFPKGSGVSDHQTSRWVSAMDPSPSRSADLAGDAPAHSGEAERWAPSSGTNHSASETSPPHPKVDTAIFLASRPGWAGS